MYLGERWHTKSHYLIATTCITHLSDIKISLTACKIPHFPHIMSTVLCIYLLKIFLHIILTREDPLQGKGLCWSEVPPTPQDGLPGCEGESPLRGLPVGLWLPPAPVSGHENISLKSCMPSIPSGMSSFRAENNSSSPRSGPLMCCSWNAVWEDWKQSKQVD